MVMNSIPQIITNDCLFISADQADLLANVSLNLTKNLYGVTELLPDDSFMVEANISLRSGAVNSGLDNYDFKWEISTIDEDTGQFFPLVVLSDNERNISISSRHMSVGLTFVRVSVVPKEMSGPVSYDFGFIRILPRLMVTVDGPEVVLIGGGSILLYSFVHGKLQDSFGNKAETVTFSWSCKVENSVSSNVTFPLETSLDKIGVNTTECFDPGILQSTRKQSLVFNPDLLISKRTYTFYVLVSQGKRFVTASHKIRVDTNISLLIK